MSGNFANKISVPTDRPDCVPVSCDSCCTKVGIAYKNTALTVQTYKYVACCPGLVIKLLISFSAKLLGNYITTEG
jgi:hypothetical protein